MVNFFRSIIIILGGVFSLSAQNLVTNGSFEEFPICPTNLSQFNAKGWRTIGYDATPDLFSMCAPDSTQANPNQYWNQVQPYKDSSYAGVVLYTVIENYREYIGTKFKRPLKKDTTYIFKVSLAIPFSSPIHSNNFDVLFTKKKLMNATNQVIITEPSFSLALDSLPTDGTWHTFEFEYKANGTEQNMQFGNFRSRKNTDWFYIDDRKKGLGREYLVGTVLIDDVQLSMKYLKKGEEVEIIKPIQPDPGLSVRFEFEELHFEINSAVLSKDAFLQLDSLIAYLLTNSGDHVEIEGHTDNTGSSTRNLILSEHRAQSVANYLEKGGVSSNRLSISGHGSSQPVSDNNTSQGRRENRRVEIKLVHDQITGN